MKWSPFIVNGSIFLNLLKTNNYQTDILLVQTSPLKPIGLTSRHHVLISAKKFDISWHLSL